MGNPPIVDGQQLQQEEVELRPNSIIYLGEMQLQVVAISIDIAAPPLSPYPVYGAGADGLT